MKPEKPELYDIWQEENPPIPELDFRMQLINYVPQFPTRAAAEKYRDAVIKEKAKK